MVKSLVRSGERPAASAPTQESAAPVVRRRTASEQSVLPATLRRLRDAAGLTLKQLGERCDISAATLSKIERGQLSPTYEKIAALARGLSVDVGCLFSPEAATVPLGRRSVSLKGSGMVHQTEQYTYEVLNADLAAKKFVPLVATIKARSLAAFPELLRHEGEEFIYVLSGQVTLYTDFYSPIELSQGDSCYLDSTMGHACISTGADNAQILWVCSNASVS